MMMYGQVVKSLWNSENRKIYNVFACGAGISNAMAKRMLPLDSTHHLGLETTLIDFLMVG